MAVDPGGPGDGPAARLIVRLRDLIKDVPAAELRGGDPEIAGVEFDSRAVTVGDLFICVVGADADGHDHAGDAVGRGAAAVLVERFLDLPPDVAQVRVSEARRSMAAVAQRFHEFPDGRLGLIGVTGTDGKTTTATLLAEILLASGRSPGLISTVDRWIGTTRLANPEHQTTLSSLESQRLLAEMVAVGNDWAVLETSSHGLDLGRVDGFAFDVALFTRITSEHLDYHGTVAAYVEAKAGLLDLVAAGGGGREKWAVLPAEDDRLELLRKRAGTIPVLTYGRGAGADVRGTAVTGSMKGVRFTAETPWGTAEIASPLVGDFNVDNCLAAIATAGALGVSLEECARGVAGFTGVVGRMQAVVTGQPFEVVIDYAHTAESLQNVLGLLARYSSGRLLLVFGGAGERDTEKRPAMGAVAALNSDYFVIADEDPRGEDRNAIAADIENGALAAKPETPYAMVHDRREAIRHVFERAEAGDTVLLAGKGHENSIIGPEGPVVWDEAGVAGEILAEMGYAPTARDAGG